MGGLETGHFLPKFMAPAEIREPISQNLQHIPIANVLTDEEVLTNIQSIPLPKSAYFGETLC